MTYSDTEFTAELRAVPDTNPPPCAVDLDVVRARGTALRRRRRAFGIGGGGLAAVGLAVALIVTLAPERPGLSPAPSPPAGQHPALSLTPTPPAGGSPRAAAGNDPLTSTVSFGWLPAGLHPSGGAPDHVVAANGVTEFDATALKPGQSLSAGCGVPVGYKGTPGIPLGEGAQNQCYAAAPDVDGHKAFWNVAPDAAPSTMGYVELAWEYAPEAWAYVDANIAKDTSSDIVGTVYKVAESVRIGPPEPVPLPFHLPSVLKGMKVETVEWQNEPSAARGFQPVDKWIGVDLTYGIPYPQANPPVSIDFLTTRSASAFPTSDELRPTGQSVPSKDVKHLTVGGHQAIEINTTVYKQQVESLVVHDFGGEDFTFTVIGKQAVDYIAAAGGVVAYFNSMHVFGGTDPNGWTTDVIG